MEFEEGGLAETCKIGYNFFESKNKNMCSTTLKNQPTFYSAIQSPAIRNSPERLEQFNFNNYHKSRYYPDKSVKGKASGIIRKQAEHLRQHHRPYQYTSPNATEFQSIEDIWNQSNQRKNKMNKAPS
jgi:hypothetical protein